jgi:hypothetical protein
MLATAAFLGSAGSLALAQLSTGPGAIVSTVRDASGRPVAGALVVAEGPTTREAVTSSIGVVTLLGLPAGTYVVRVTRSGFAPSGTSVSVGAKADGIKVVRLRLSPAAFANLSGAASIPVAAGLDAGNAPSVAEGLTASLATNLAPTYLGKGIGATLEGTQPGETRAELDGIPIAGIAPGPAALRYSNALQLDGVELVEGPAISGTSPDGAIGGIINYRTAPIATSLDAGFAAGYDSSFKAFQNLRFSNTYGKLGVLTNLVAGDGPDHSQILKARIALSPATSVDLATYGSQSLVTQGTTSYANVAPASALDLRTTLGTGTLQGRLFDSESDTTTTPAAPAQAEDWRIRGMQLAYDIPFVENLFSVGFEREAQSVAFAGAAPLDETLSTLRLGTDLQLSRLSRLELADAIGSGTGVPRRNDPQIALALSPDPKLTLRFGAGSAYATPLEVLAASGLDNPVAQAPETSFGFRASADAALGTADHVRIAAFELRRFDTFSALADGRSSGIELGFERPALPGRLGIVAGVDFSRTYAFGSQQPLERYAGLPLLAGEQLGSDPFTKARLALAYRANSRELDFGATLLGANNALSSRAVLLGDASLKLTAGSLADVRLGIENLFGQTISDPELAPLYPRHEYTLTVGRTTGGS